MTPLGLLFCADPLDLAAPEPDFTAERDAAQACGLPWGLIDHDALVGGDLRRALRRTPALPAGTVALYRGWMLTPAQYAALEPALLRQQGVTLLTDARQYRTAHLLPEAYPHIAPYTAPSVWIAAEDGVDLRAAGRAALKGFSGGVVLKDYVKSLHHLWSSAGFIPDAADLSKAMPILERFLAELGPSLVGGLVLRAALPLVQVGLHPETNAPLVQEYRRFYLDGELLAQAPRRPPSSPDEAAPPPSLFAAVARRFPARFFSMDLVRLAGDGAGDGDGGWVILEVGDGQVSACPPTMPPAVLYEGLVRWAQGAEGSGT